MAEIAELQLGFLDDREILDSRLAHLAGLGPHLGKRLSVGGIVALNRQEADARVLPSVKALSFLAARRFLFGLEALDQAPIALATKGRGGVQVRVRTGHVPDRLDRGIA